MSLEHMLQDEREAWRFWLEEAARQGEFGMSIMNINRMQDEALRAYDLHPPDEAAAWAQVVAQCEIAQQLARIATQSERIATVLDNWYQNGVPIENAGGH